MSALILLAVTYAAWRAVPPAGFAHGFGTAVACIPSAVALGAFLFVVVGYEVDASELRVRRLLWATALNLKGVNRIWQDPEVIKGSLRVFGNGGFLSFSGVFWSKRLGRYRIFATDLKRCVVLVLTDRVVVVTPADPDAFIRHIRTLFPNAQGRDR
ncbi:MAG: PH domain-containing protein [Thermoanaerobaculia bacterium]